MWATYVGGAGFDQLKAVKYGDTKIVAAGESSSSNIQVLDGGNDAHDEPNAGGQDVMLFEFDLNGVQQWGTYLGGSNVENLGYHGLALQPSTGDGKEDIFLVGMSSSMDLPFKQGPNWYDFTPKNGLQGFVARFSGSDNSLKWMSYAKGTGQNLGSTNWESVVLDTRSHIYLGGFTTDVNYVPEQAWGLYSATARLGAGDGTIMCFSNDQELLWSTFFGGNETGIIGDRIETLATWRDERLFAAGYTYTNYDAQTFFPFTDPVGDDDWFDSSFYPATDGFLAAFCIEGLLTGVADVKPNRPGAGFAVHYGSDGGYQLVGLPEGIHPWLIVDGQGRLMRETRSIVGNEPLRFALDGMATGIYLVVVPGLGAQRLVHNP